MSIHYDFVGFQDKNGDLGRPVPAGQIAVPQRIWLEDDCIRWKMGTNPGVREVSRSMLNQFIRLTDAHSVLRFAKNWGVLALSGNLSSGSDPGGEFYLPARERMKEGAEPVSAWQYYSRRAQALINVAAALKQGKLGDMSDWGEFAAFFSNRGERERVMKWVDASWDRHHFGLGITVVLFGFENREERLERAGNVVAKEVGAWLECWRRDRTDEPSDFASRWMDKQQRWSLEIDYHGLLFPAIALQLALVLADADSLYTCSGCGIPYVRPRERKRPKSGWANYCDQCSKDGVAQRRAAETYREKRAEAVRLHSGGASVSEIAEQTRTTVARVRGWLERGEKDAKAKTRKQRRLDL